MFYFNTFSFLDTIVRLTTLHSTRISKKLGERLSFYDLNLSFPLWESGDKAKILVQKPWDLQSCRYRSVKK